MCRLLAAKSRDSVRNKSLRKFLKCRNKRVRPLQYIFTVGGNADGWSPLCELVTGAGDSIRYTGIFVHLFITEFLA